MAEDDDRGRWHAVGARRHFPKRRGMTCQAGSLRVAVFEYDGELFAIDDRCPHAGASLGRGPMKGLLVSCPRHGWRFNVRDGRCLDSALCEAHTRPLRVRAGQVEVFVAETPETP